MEDLLDILKRFWWVAFIVIPWALSAIADVFTKAARKAAKEERVHRRERGSGRQGGPHAAAAEPQKPTQAEVAAEIRRMMGMEVAEERRSPGPQRPVVVLEEDWDDPEEWRQTEWQEAEVSETEWQPAEPHAAHQTQDPKFGSLHERMAHREQRQVSRVEGRHIQPATEHGGVHDRHLQTGLMQKLRSREGAHAQHGSLPHAVGRRRQVDLSDPARAIVMMEILGPPKALREPD